MVLQISHCIDWLASNQYGTPEPHVLVLHGVLFHSTLVHCKQIEEVLIATWQEC